MYEMMSKWDRTAAALPALVARLQALRGIHEEAGSSVVRLQKLQRQQEDVTKLLQSSRAALDKVQESLAGNMKVMEGNVTLLQGRIEALTKKLQS